MIEYDYSFSRNEKDTTIILHPTYKSPFFNVSNLKGGSSTGKSTLMNLIALAFWGHDDPKIQQSLRNRVRYIYDSEKIQIDFVVEMTAADGSVLKSHVIKKSDGIRSKPEINVRFRDKDGNEHPIFKEEFRQKYSLIYDIPDNPTKRIDESLKQIQSAQRKYLDRVRELKKAVISVQGDVKNSRDPDKIEEYKEKISKAKKEREDCEQNLSTETILLDSLRRYYWASIIVETDQELSKVDNEISEIKKQDRKVKKVNKAQKSGYKLAVDNHNIKVCNLCSSYRASIVSLEKIRSYGDIDKILIDNWSRYDLNSNNLGIGADIPDDFIQNASNIVDILKELCNKYESQQDNQKYDLLKSIMDILKNYSDGVGSEIKILDKTTDTIYGELEAELNEIEKKVTLFKDYSVALTNLRNCLQGAGDVHQSFINIPKKPVDEEAPETDDELLAHLQDLIDRLDELEKKASKYDVYYDDVASIIKQSKNDPLLSPYIGLSTQALDEKIGLLVREVDDLRDEIYGHNGYNDKIRYLDEKLSGLEKCKDHPLSCYNRKIDVLIKELDKVQSDLGIKDNVLERILDKQNNLISVIQDSEEGVYLRHVWSNLGKRFGHIRHMGQDYEIVNVNIIDSIMVTTTGKEFSINDMGTGESQSAYLMNVLRSNENSCIIAMFDESENMDYELRQGVLKRFKELYDSGHLILGLTASHHGGSETESIVEEYDGYRQ